jgi:hypothetical protein
MRQGNFPAFFALEQMDHWQMREPKIWSRRDAEIDSNPSLSILTTLWDQPRWLEAYHLYEQHGSELFEQI